MLFFGRGRGRRRNKRYLAEADTLFGRARIFDLHPDDDETMRILDVESTWQSACYLEPHADELAFRYHRRFADLVMMRWPYGGRALMLGGGGFAFPSWLVRHDPQAEVDAVEIDPTIIELAERWLALSFLTPEERGRLRVICSDATTYLRELGASGRSGSYDLVVNDLFAAERPERTLMEASGMLLAKAALAPGGIYLANVVSALKGSRSRPLSMVTEALGQTFAHQLVLPLGADAPRVPDNNIVIASDHELDLFE